MITWWAITLATAQPAPGFRCTDCHPAGVAEHLRDWDHSLHATAGVTCESCHPRPSAGAPASHVLWSDQLAVSAMCGRCHDEVAEVFRHSAHVRGAMPSGRRPTCVDCHDAAGGRVLAEEAFAERCGACHAAGDSQRAGSTAARGLAVLHDLRRLSLARALVEDALLRHQRQGGDASAGLARLHEVTADLRDIAQEWHRFDLDAAQRRSRRALAALTALHRRLEEEQP